MVGRWAKRVVRERSEFSMPTGNQTIVQKIHLFHSSIVVIRVGKKLLC